MGTAYVFGLGFLGAVMSSVQFVSIHPPLNQENATNRQEPKLLKQIFLPSNTQLRPIYLRVPPSNNDHTSFPFPSCSIFTHPIFPIYSVNVLKLNDQVISLGTAIINPRVVSWIHAIFPIDPPVSQPVILCRDDVDLAIFPVLLASPAEHRCIYWHM
jgi:hypothetical protein